MEFADYVPQIVWLVITFATLYFLMAKLALPRITDILETRQRRLDHDLELTETLRDDATAALAEYESAIAAARGESELILAEAHERIHSEARQQLDDLNARLEGEIAESDARIGNIMTQAMGELAVAASDAARTATERLIGFEVSEERARDAVDTIRES
jgi:F-type H+-transporting ATPase subunit b